MHTKPMAESEGNFSDMKPCEGKKCPKCGKEEIFYKVWESSCGGHEDYKFTCRACGHSWWIDGIDS